MAYVCIDVYAAIQMYAWWDFTNLTCDIHRSGKYKVGEQWYLEGSVHTDKLSAGIPCELFVEVNVYSFVYTSRYSTQVLNMRVCM